jgi:signal transduction histidine kinase
MAVVFALLGGVVYHRVRTDLDTTLDQGLRSRASVLAELTQPGNPDLEAAGASRLVDQDEAYAEILAPDGSVVTATPQIQRLALLTPAERKRATRQSFFVTRRRLAALDGRPRLFAASVTAANGRKLTVVVGTTLGDRDESLGSLARLLLIAGPLALLLAALAGYALVARALRPVERMRRQAAAISTTEHSERLPVPTARDEIRRLGETLNEMLSRLEATFARERRFVADASHELRTPLTILRAELELALRGERSHEELRAAVLSAAEETDRLHRLADDLLMLAGLDQHEQPVRREPIDVADLLGQIIRRFGDRAYAAERQIAVDCPAGLAINADPRGLERALANLTDNALRHGGGDVQLAATVAGDSLELHVRDHGPGVAEAFIPHAFERFSQADQRSAGSGLGLAIVAAVAAANGGRPGLRNRPGGGADAWIELPLDPPAQRRSTETSSESSRGPRTDVSLTWPTPRT